MNEYRKEDYVKIAILESIVEAQVIASILEEENIPFMIRSYHDTAYNGLYQFQKGWGELSAPAACQENILNILNEIRADSFHAEENFEDQDKEEDEDRR